MVWANEKEVDRQWDWAKACKSKSGLFLFDKNICSLRLSIYFFRWMLRLKRPPLFICTHTFSSCTESRGARAREGANDIQFSAACILCEWTRQSAIVGANRQKWIERQNATNTNFMPLDFVCKERVKYNRIVSLEQSTVLMVLWHCTGSCAFFFFIHSLAIMKIVTHTHI